MIVWVSVVLRRTVYGDVVVQFYPWFNFYFLLFYFIIIYLHEKEPRKIKIEPRIKLNYNSSTE